ncbi:hypothetical protein HNQ35_000074 [Cerasibacillus quisquiliarum]|uniref:MurNAc-LAA domain-containing protein n=1 Tax=Cerasibacillus quisquiliarum TaxID=227865 RepID=A0A511UXN5_9BACI|nr:N-acetylmuramoyl-L-alanine amidase [Cerasibacillus quisquiliarum]MBB5144885.1 hypothetical protein [Cerasibacillus quisquiliarum]GEN30223.1 hypothetical protein CQU01_04610 [Cerasibacillus quisquiliarum]
MTKIYIDAGHGGSDPGAVGNGLREKDLTLMIAKHTQDYLKGYNCSVKMSRTNDKTLSLAQRTNDANKWGADFFLSVHINAGGGTGYEDFIYNGVSNTSKSAKLRNTIHSEISKVLTKYSITNRGKKKANFHVLRETKMPAVLTENLFIDRREDANLLKDDKFLKDIGQAHAKGIVKAFKLKGGSGSTSTSKPSKPKQSKTSKSNNKQTSNYTGDSIVDYLKSIGQPSSFAHRKKLAQQHGIKNYTGTASQNTKLLNALRGNKTTATSVKNYIPRTFKVGQRVRIKSSAKTYSRSNVPIPSKYKNKSLTIQQVGKDDVLIKELYSWVRKSDTY